MKQKLLLLSIALLCYVGAFADKVYIFGEGVQELDDATANISDVTIQQGKFGYAVLTINVGSREVNAFQIEWLKSDMPAGLILAKQEDVETLNDSFEFVKDDCAEAYPAIVPHRACSR